MADDTKHRIQCYARLAQCVLKQWERDGKPSIKPEVLEYWKDLALTDQDDLNDHNGSIGAVKPGAE